MRKNITLVIMALKKFCNKNKQYARNWSIRIHGLYVPSDLVKRVGADEAACIITAYTVVIEPVLSKLTPKPGNLDEDIKWGP